jgi:hypothetical protein
MVDEQGILFAITHAGKKRTEEPVLRTLPVERALSVLADL